MREEMESVHNQTKFVIWLITKITEKCKTIEEVRSVNEELRVQVAGLSCDDYLPEETRENGMTDLQFKSYLKRIVRYLEEAEKESTKEGIIKRISELKKDLNDDIQD